MSDNQRFGEAPWTPEEPSTILVVEDDPFSLRVTEAMLEDAGYTTCGAADGRLGLQKLSEIDPDLIIMDVFMPNMDGLEACRRLQMDEQLRRIPVIFVTGRIDEETLQAAFEAGGSDYVHKPVNRIELLSRVRTALSQRRMTQKLAQEEKLKGFLEMAGGICHELNQPLQYVLGAVQLLMMDVANDDILYAQLDAIRARVEQMGEMTRKLTAITRLRTRKYVGDLDIIDIEQCIGSRDQ